MVNARAHNHTSSFLQHLKVSKPGVQHTVFSSYQLNIFKELGEEHRCGLIRHRRVFPHNSVYDKRVCAGFGRFVGHLRVTEGSDRGPVAPCFTKPPALPSGPNARKKTLSVGRIRSIVANDSFVRDIRFINLSKLDALEIADEWHTFSTRKGLPNGRARAG